MATKTKIPETTVSEGTFSKDQILSAQKYAGRRDLLAALLTDDRSYTLAEVDRVINEFMKKEVK